MMRGGIGYSMDAARPSDMVYEMDGIDKDDEYVDAGRERSSQRRHCEKVSEMMTSQAAREQH